MKDKKGFTLIELLAVIVVLAIVMVLAVTTVLPLMSKSQVNAFILEVNNAREATSNMMTLISINQADDFNLAAGEDYQVNSAGTKYCFTLKKLAEAGIWTKNIEAVTKQAGEDHAEYEGKIIVTSAEGTNNYTYTITMHNANYYITTNKTAKEGDEQAYSNQSGYTCSSTDVNS